MTDKLSDQIEAASAGSRELDAEIAVAIGYERDGDELWFEGECYSIREPDYYELAGQNRELKHFSTSLDAAMALVPEGWRWDVSTRIDGSRGVVYLHSPDRAKWRDAGGFAATPALALCAAALRARGM